MLKERMRQRQVDSLALKYFKQGVQARESGRTVRACTYDNMFKRSHWVRGYYSKKKEESNVKDAS